MTSERIRPTRGFLIEYRERLEVIRDGKELLEMKRDELSTKLRELLDDLEAARAIFTEEVENALKQLRIAYAHIGPNLIDAFAGSLKEEVKVKILSSMIMGVKVPFVRIDSLPETRDNYPPILRKTAKNFQELLKDLFKVTELEVKIERIADELERTNRIVNTLGEVIIPNMEENIKNIEDKLEEERMEEFIRVKQVKDKGAE